MILFKYSFLAKCVLIVAIATLQLPRGTGYLLGCSERFVVGIHADEMY